MKKKILSAILMMSVLLTLTACSDGSAPSSPLDLLNSGKSSTGEAKKPQIDPDTIAESPAEDFEYEYNKDLGGVVIKKYIGSKISVKIPTSFEGFSVVAIGDEAFKECTGVAGVIIPDGVKTIGDSAFLGSGVTYALIPNSVTKIGISAFEGCTGLTSVTIPDSVTIIDGRAFSGCTGLTGIVIPDSVEKIYSCAFSGCTSLEYVEIGDCVDYEDYEDDDTDVTVIYTSSYYNLFGGCENLKNVTFRDGTKTIGGFYGCKALKSVTIPNSVTKIRGRAFLGCTGLTSVTIPDGVTEIWWSAFGECTGLTSISIPNSVTTIGKNAFNGCTGLTSVTIPNSVKTIGKGAFFGCEGLTSITIPSGITEIGWFPWGVTTINVDSNNQNYTSKDGVLYNKDMTTLIRCPVKKRGAFSIPNSVTTIGDYAFEGCEGLTSITIPNSVTEIGGSAFSGCTGLTSVIIPNSVTTIGKYAFSGCTGLTSVTIPNSVTTIGNHAFSGCTGLTSITIPNSVTEIGEEAFYNCTAEITYKGKTYSSDNYFDLYDAINLISPASYYEYKYNNEFGGIEITKYIGNRSVVKIPDEIDGERVVAIGGYDDYGAFYKCTGITSVTIPDSVTRIGEEAFYNCTAAITYKGKTYSSDNYSDLYDAINFSSPASYLEYKYNNEFGGIEITKYIGNSSAVKIPNEIDGKRVASIGNNAFSSCDGLTSITIPNSVTAIGNSAFSYCTGLTSVTIPNSVTAIGEKAFWYCTGLTSVTIPNSVTTIGNYAFSSCYDLTSITIPDSVTTIGNYAFSECYGLTSITIPNSVTTVGKGAFSRCTRLTSITIPNSVKKIDWFYGCDGLTTIHVDSNNQNFTSKDGVLYNKGMTTLIQCPAKKQGEFSIPNSVTRIDDSAFNNCKGLTSVTIPDSVTKIGEYSFFGCTAKIKYKGKRYSSDNYSDYFDLYDAINNR